MRGPDHVFTRPAGVVVSRSEVLRGLRERTVAVDSYRVEDLDVRHHGHAAIVMGRAEGIGTTPGGEPFSGVYSFTSAWLHSDGDSTLLTWSAIAIDGSVTPPPPVEAT